MNQQIFLSFLAQMQNGTDAKSAAANLQGTYNQSIIDDFMRQVNQTDTEHQIVQYVNDNGNGNATIDSVNSYIDQVQGNITQNQDNLNNLIDQAQQNVTNAVKKNTTQGNSGDAQSAASSVTMSVVGAIVLAVSQ